MWTKCTFSVVLLLGLVTSNARADGLFYQLPEDRAWVRFDMELTHVRDGMQETSPAMLTMASVGQAVEGADQCRWLEIKLQMMEQGAEHTIIAKVLIPEKHLKKGETPIDHIVRGWLKESNKEPVKLEAPNLGPLPAFLAGPLQAEQKLDKEVVESKLGKLECEGVTGSTQFKEGEGDFKITFHNRLHPKAPFGLVSSRLEFEKMSNGQIVESGKGVLRLADFGKDAQSELPGHQ